MKRCSTCKAEKEDEGFSRWSLGEDGLQNRCRQCHRKARLEKYWEDPESARGRVRNYYWSHLEERRKQALEYIKRNHKAVVKKKRKRNEENREKFRVEAKDRYWRDPDKYRRAAKEQRKKHPDKVKARRILANEVRSGRMSRPENCSSCGENRKIHAHHDDYSKPLDVQWLCSLCHGLTRRRVDV